MGAEFVAILLGAFGLGAGVQIIALLARRGQP